jgi:uncharacterized protein (TIGR00255 family)
MIKSMTGFASGSRELDTATLGITARTVNHRYLDVQVRLPPLLAPVEVELRGVVQRWVARGRVEVAVTARLLGQPEVEVALNEPLVDALSAAVEQARARGVVAAGLTAGDLLGFPRALVVEELELDEAGRAELGRAAIAAAGDVLRDLDAMRAREGGYLLADLEARCGTLSDLVARLEAAAESGRAGLVSRLNARVEELRAQAGVEEATVAQEVVRFAARSDVSEEITRLRGHLAHWSALTGSAEPCGRKLDFLLQEMNREVNTLGAKAEGAEASELVVTAKAELEKLREQVQNVE